MVPVAVSSYFQWAHTLRGFLLFWKSNINSRAFPFLQSPLPANLNFPALVYMETFSHVPATHTSFSPSIFSSHYRFHISPELSMISLPSCFIIHNNFTINMLTCYSLFIDSPRFFPSSHFPPNHFFSTLLEFVLIWWWNLRIERLFWRPVFHLL